VVLADDLIWSSRLAGIVRAAGDVPVLVGRREDARAASAGAAGALVDLTSRAYDGVAAVADLAAAGIPVVCLAQHDDRDLRRRALAAGADRVLAYRAVHERGAAILAGWPARTTREEETA
jgi:DNA-binding NarL/FixJ family response regulator